MLCCAPSVLLCLMWCIWVFYIIASILALYIIMYIFEYSIWLLYLSIYVTILLLFYYYIHTCYYVIFYLIIIFDLSDFIMSNLAPADERLLIIRFRRMMYLIICLINICIRVIYIYIYIYIFLDYIRVFYLIIYLMMYLIIYPNLAPADDRLQGSPRGSAGPGAL